MLYNGSCLPGKPWHILLVLQSPKVAAFPVLTTSHFARASDAEK